MRKVISFLYLLLIIGCLFILSLLAFGLKPHNVISDSMAPKIHKYALTFIKTIDKDKVEEIDFKEGQIIAFNKSGELVLHRIYDFAEDGRIITKGDANNTTDAPITKADIVGIYKFHIPLIGLLFISIYPWIIIIGIVIGYHLIIQIKKEIKKDRDENND